jgi:hypothetical protein
LLFDTIYLLPVKLKKKLPYSETSQVPGQMEPLTEDQGYDNVLLGQGYRKPRGVVIDEYGATVE